MKHIASCSFGKDSMATIILAIQHGDPLDEVAYCEVMFDSKTSGEIPEHRDFIYEKAIPFVESHGIKVNVLKSCWTYIDGFYHINTKGRWKGKIRGFAICGMCWVNRDCKLKPIREYIKTIPDDAVQYIGIAADEQERLMRLDGNKVSLLNKYGVDEAAAFEICRKSGLLSPAYEFTNRQGCFFCPNAKDAELRHLYDHHRDLWERMLELQAAPNKCTDLFNRTMRFSDIDYNFRMDDAQITIFDLL